MHLFIFYYKIITCLNTKYNSPQDTLYVSKISREYYTYLHTFTLDFILKQCYNFNKKKYRLLVCLMLK